MLAIIALNVVFAALVVGGIVGLLGRSIWTSRLETAPAQPARSRTAQRAARRRLATVAG